MKSVIYFGTLLFLEIIFSLYGYGQPIPVTFTPLNRPAYMDEIVVKTRGITTYGHAENLTTAQGLHTRTYFDGLGRPIQKISSGIGTAGKPDVVSFSVYDVYGREKKRYLPFAANTSRLFQADVVNAQASFYAIGSGKYAKDGDPYSVSEYDSSPLNEIWREGSVGSAWQPAMGKMSAIVLRTNTSSDAVRQFNTDGSINGLWPSGTLSVSETTDEEGHKILVFADKLGNTILKRQWLDETIQGAYKDYKNTYYIYDKGSLLVMMIPPKVVDRIMNNNWLLSTDDLDNNVYRYEYDYKGRQTAKKLPSSGWVYTIYDKLDRISLIQTAVHRSVNKWYFMKYDRLGRIVMQGILKDDTRTTVTSMQAFCDTYDYLNTAVPYFESKGGPVQNYSDLSFPQSASFTFFEPLKVNYYDHYDIDQNGAANYSYASQSLGAEEPIAVSAHGQLTVAKSKKLGTSDWMTKVYFYDGNGRVVQEQSNNPTNIGLNDVHTNVLDFAGLLQRSVNKKTINATQHTVDENMVYDNAARLLSASHKYDGNAAVTLADYVYNELGQLVDKNLGKLGPGSYLQSVDLRYNIRGWVTGINNADLNTDDYNEESNDVFGMEILYNASGGTGNTGMFNGQISGVKWKMKMSSHPYDNVGRAYNYSYDKLGQLRNALFYGKNGSGWTYRNGAYDEKNITYDLNGNILSLERNNWTGTVVSMDNLTYSYKSASGGDKLMQVMDANGTGGTYGFKNQSGDSEHYLYDGDGNLTQDKNKNLSYSYNDLGKVERVTLLSYTNRYLQYNYDGAGICLSKQVVDNGSTVKTTAYVEGFVAVDNVLNYINTIEGRVRTASGVGTYEYHIKDHLGNVRVSFENQGGVAVVRQENSFYAFGLMHNSSPVISGANKEIVAGAIWDDDFGNYPDLYTMPFRQYDPVLGRFNAVDPMAEKYDDLTVYNFAFNNPVTFSDPSGADPIGSWEELSQIINQLWNSSYGGSWNIYDSQPMFFNSPVDSFHWGASHMQKNNLWGTSNFATDYLSAAGNFNKKMESRGESHRAGTPDGNGFVAVNSVYDEPGFALKGLKSAMYKVTSVAENIWNSMYDEAAQRRVAALKKGDIIGYLDYGDAPVFGLGGFGSAATKINGLRVVISGSKNAAPVYYSVYRAITKEGGVYWGMTKNFAKRSAQHGNRFASIKEVHFNIIGRATARGVEQLMIDGAGGIKNLENIINSIGAKNPNIVIYYKQAIKFLEK